MSNQKSNITPFGDNIFLKVEQASLGGLDTSAIKTGVEWGIIEALGPDVPSRGLKVGMKVFCKAWAIDTVLYENKEYYFTSEARKGIVAIVK